MPLNSRQIMFDNDEDRSAILYALIRWYLDTYPEGTSIKMSAEEILLDIEQSTENQLIQDATAAVG